MRFLCAITISMFIGIAATGIETAIRENTSAYLCVEAAKLHVQKPQCDKILKGKP